MSIRAALTNHKPAAVVIKLGAAQSQGVLHTTLFKRLKVALKAAGNPAELLEEPVASEGSDGLRRGTEQLF